MSRRWRPRGSLSGSTSAAGQVAGLITYRTKVLRLKSKKRHLAWFRRDLERPGTLQQVPLAQRHDVKREPHFAGLRGADACGVE